MRGSLRRRVRAGFTLLELMIVVTIVGILAATAMPAFQSYLMRSRANEGRMMVEVIKLRQEAYRSEFGSYVDSGGANPATVSGMNYVAWTTNAAWTALGFAPPSNRTRFALSTVARAPGVSVRGMTGNDFSFYANATGDLDSDGQAITFESYSEADFIYCNRANGYE